MNAAGAAAWAMASIGEHIFSSRLTTKFELRLSFFVSTGTLLAFDIQPSAGLTEPFVVRSFRRYEFFLSMLFF